MEPTLVSAANESRQKRKGLTLVADVVMNLSVSKSVGCSLDDLAQSLSQATGLQSTDSLWMKHGELFQQGG
jgi:hypothetical protein